VPPVVGRLMVAGLGFVSLLLAHGVAHADIFHCVDAGGVHVYRDSPCATGTRTAGTFISAPVEQRGVQDEDLRYAYRIQELEREVAELRAALQSMQVAALPIPAQEPAYPSVPVQVPVSPAPVQEPVYPAIPVVIVPGGCYGRACGHHPHPNHHHDSDHRPARHDADNPHRRRPAELARGDPHDPVRRP